MKDVSVPSAEPSIQFVSKPTASEPPAPATKTPPAKNNDDSKKTKAEKKGKHASETIRVHLCCDEVSSATPSKTFAMSKSDLFELVAKSTPN